MHQSYKNSVCGLFSYSLETENCLYIFLKFYFILDRVGHDWSDLAAATAELINNVKIVSGVQQSDSVILIHGSILSQIFFPFRLLQNIEQSSQCYTVGPCWLSILNIIHANPKLPNVKREGKSKKGRRKEHVKEIICGSQSLQ